MFGRQPEHVNWDCHLDPPETIEPILPLSLAPHAALCRELAYHDEARDAVEALLAGLGITEVAVTGDEWDKHVDERGW